MCAENTAQNNCPMSYVLSAFCLFLKKVDSF